MTVEEGMKLCCLLTIIAVRKYGLRSTDHDDVLSDAYEGLCLGMARADEALETDRSQAFIRRYINGHIMHGIRSRYRKNLHGAWLSAGSMVQSEVEEEHLPYAVSEDETRRELWDAVNRLPPKWRLALLLNLHYGYSQDEVAEMMGVTQMSVSRYVRYGQKELAEGLINA